MLPTRYILRAGPVSYFVILSLLMIASTSFAQETKDQYSDDKRVIQNGRTLFNQLCTSCHNFTQRGIGPDLSGATEEFSPVWLAKFIRNPTEIIDSGDEKAAKMFAEYKTYMPSHLSLSDHEIMALLSYINTYKRKKEETTAYGTPVNNPVPAKIAKGGLTLKLQLLAIAPPSAEKIPLARINQTVILKSKKERVFIQDLRGALYEIRKNKLIEVMHIGKLKPSFIHAPGLASGFGSFAFHPDFMQNGLLYTTHTEKANTLPADYTYSDSIKTALQWVVTEWKIKNSSSIEFSATSRELLRVDMPSPMHGVQQLTFNPLARSGSPDYGLLYIGIGDGGSAENGYSYLCNSNLHIWGTILRIDPEGRNSKNKKFGIPSINPFVNDHNTSSLGEVFAYGFRNPNRICWSPDGKMLISDIGLNNIEELNIGIAGGNYGWPAREGTFLLNYKGKMDKVYPLPQKDSNYIYPVLQYDHDEGNAFSGGFVYTGSIPLLKNKYIFGDIVRGRVFYTESDRIRLGSQSQIKEFDLQFEGIASDFKTMVANGKADMRFGVGPNHTLYIFTKTDGKIWEVTGCEPGL